MPLAILMADAFGRPTTDGIDDFRWTFNGTEAIPQTATEGVNDTSMWTQMYFQQCFSILSIHRCSTGRSYPLPYDWPTLLLVHPPSTSAISFGASTALNLSRRLCRKEWITHPSGTNGFIHLFSVALAEFELHLVAFVKRGNANSVSVRSRIR